MMKITASNTTSKTRNFNCLQKIHSFNKYLLCTTSKEIYQCTKQSAWSFRNYIPLKESNNRETSKYISAIKKNKKGEGTPL